MMNTSEKQKPLPFLQPNKGKSIYTVLLVAICSLGLILASCGDNSTGANGDSGNGDDENGEEPPPPEPTFTNVSDILESSCSGSGCHVGERTSGVRLDSYDNVMESEGHQYGELIVQEEDAAGSPIVDKIESSNPEHGERMPPGGPFLSQDDIDLIKEWINDGAENN